jgi:hypothetical protein
MMQRIFFSTFTIAILVFTVARGPAFGQQPRRPPGEPMSPIVDYEPPPATLRGLFADVAVVVRGRVISSSPRLRNQSIPLTAHDFQIDEVFKPDSTGLPKSASNITVIQDGGTSEDLNGRVVTMAVKDVYKPGQEVILFLRASPGDGGFTMAYGPSGGFLVVNNDVLVPERVRSHYSELNGRQSIPTAAFVQLLRQFAIAK